MTLGEVLAATTEYLARKGVDTPRLDAELILAKAFGLTRIELYTSFDKPLNEAERAVARTLVERRGRREPLAYVLGEWGFRRLTLLTDARALVPRPETETVVERALAAIAGLEAPAVVDVGTGTGAIALAIADEHPGADVTATDISPDALALARENADRLGLAVAFVETDLLAGLAGPFDLVVSNPPYVTEGEIEGLQPEVRDWEPRVALVGDRTVELAGAARDGAPAGRRDRARDPRGSRRRDRGRARRPGFSRGYDLQGPRGKGEGGRSAMAAGDVARAIEAIRAGEAVLLPADGVYGLCASAYREGPVHRLYEVKGRDAGQPSAMIAASVAMLIECVPELRGRSEVIVRALLPGPFTLVLPNPARRYGWLTGERPDTIGVRVADLPTESQYVLDAVGAVAATSANDPGRPVAGEPRRRARRGSGKVARPRSTPARSPGSPRP